MYSFRQLQPTEDLWKQIEKSPDATCFHTSAWGQHLQNTYHYNLFIVEITSECACGGGGSLVFASAKDTFMHHQWEQELIHKGLLLYQK